MLKEAKHKSINIKNPNKEVQTRRGGTKTVRRMGIRCGEKAGKPILNGLRLLTSRIKGDHRSISAYYRI